MPTIPVNVFLQSSVLIPQLPQPVYGTIHTAHIFFEVPLIASCRERVKSKEKEQDPAPPLRNPPPPPHPTPPVLLLTLNQ